MTAPRYDGRHDAAIHQWFELSYAHYLVLPRSLLQAMPVEWQERFVTCLKEMDMLTCDLGANDNYTVLLRGKNGRIVKDPYSEYRRPVIKTLPVNP